MSAQNDAPTSSQDDMLAAASDEIRALIEAGHPVRLIAIEMAHEVLRLRADLSALAAACSWSTIVVSHIGEAPFGVTDVEDYATFDRILRPFSGTGGDR